MMLGWLLRRLGGRREQMGPFDYLASRNKCKSQIDLENARRETARVLLGNLPRGAVYRAGTVDSWIETRMPPQPQTSPPSACRRLSRCRTWSAPEVQALPVRRGPGWPRRTEGRADGAAANRGDGGAAENG